MRAVSESFKSAALAPVREWKIEAKLYAQGDNGDELVETLTSDDAIISAVITETGALFTSAASSATLKVTECDALAQDDYVGLTAKLSLSIRLSDGTFATVSQGSYVVDTVDVDKDKGTRTLNLIDSMTTLQRSNYQVGVVEWPLSVANLALGVASHFELTLASMSALPNTTYSIQEDLYANISDVTYRSILEEIAGATASMAVIDDGVLSFRPPQMTINQNLTYGGLKTLRLGEHYGPVNSVVLARTPQEDNIAITDDTSVAANGLTEVKLANNEIMDDEREVFAEPILEAVEGLEWTGFEATTVGLGWLTVGDRVSFTDDAGNIYEGIITDLSRTIDGGVKETIKGVIPEETTTDYALAGGISKTIYNTQIKVDKQNQQIESVVSEQVSMGDQIAENFTQVTQTLTEIITAVQNSGGNNLIKNSAMFLKGDDGKPTSWTIAGTGSLTITPSAEALNAGVLSGQMIGLEGETISQVINVVADSESIPEAEKSYYSFSCRIKKTAASEGSVVLSDGINEWEIEAPNGEDLEYKEFVIEGMLPVSTLLTLTVTGSSAGEFSIGDMMLVPGTTRSNWTQANGELANTQLQVDSSGIKVTSSTTSGAYSAMNAQGVTVYRNGQPVASLTNDGVEAPSASVTEAISMPPLRIQPTSEGWAFVPIN